MLKKIFIILGLVSPLLGKNPPDWAKDAIWYQIFPERFYNGDTTNDPTKESLLGTWPWEVQKEWAITPWTTDWYAFQPWEEANGQPFNYQFQLRRYGGDIQGILDKLDYLEELGINAIYLNPVFDSPSNHKYGASTYHHIDRHFGPDPEDDSNIIAHENPTDPSTWKWTSADKLFLTLIKEVHKRRMHIIIDGVFNHVGLTFWAFQDVIKKRENSPFYNWFTVEGSGLDDRSYLNDYHSLPEYFLRGHQDSLKYKGYVADLPAFRQDEFGPVQPVRDYIHLIIQRWMDPNGDGDPSDGIDGWRLDVAERIQIKFWDLFCRWVKDLNPEAFVTGEVWWEDWGNNKQFNASPWLTEKRFDSVMNYRFGDAMFKFFINQNQQITALELDQLLSEIRKEYPPETAYVLQNCLDSHDMERLASAIVNPDRWIDHANNLQYNREFDIRKPNVKERQIQKEILAFQFTYIGAPYIYYGDEVGMWGADDPDNRKPMVWREYKYQPEVTHPCDRLEDCNYTRPVDSVYVDEELLSYYKSLIQIRKDHIALRRGSYHTIWIDKDHGIFAFLREYQKDQILAIFNGSFSEIKISEDIFPNKRENWTLVFGEVSQGNVLHAKSSQIYFKH